MIKPDFPLKRTEATFTACRCTGNVATDRCRREPMYKQRLLLLASTHHFSNTRKQMLVIWNKTATSLVNLKIPKHPLQVRLYVHGQNSEGFELEFFFFLKKNCIWKLVEKKKEFHGFILQSKYSSFLYSPFCFILSAISLFNEVS